MNIRFEVDQAECFRRGIDAPKSIVTIDVNPAEIIEAERALIADRLNGIDVCKLYVDGNAKLCNTYDRVKANTPDYEGLIEAVFENHRAVQEEINKIKKNND